MWDSTDILKTLGILFIIVMVWYIVFIIFQENKRFLLSLTSSEDNNNSEIPNLFKNVIPGLKEGMSDNQVGDYEKIIERLDDQNKFFLLQLFEIGSDPDVDQSKLKPKLVLKRLETQLKTLKLWCGIISLDLDQAMIQLDKDDTGIRMVRTQNFLLNQIKMTKIGISFLKDSKEEVEESGIW